MPVIFRFDQDLELIGDLMLLRDPDGADLDDLTPDLYRQHLLCGRRARPGLIPFHIQYDVIHDVQPLFIIINDIIAKKFPAVNKKFAFF